MKAPDAFRTISEVAEELDLPQHVLRFWETRFSQIKPMKRGGGRRYYRPEDVDLLRGVRLLLYSEGLTIRGVQRVLKDKGLAYVSAIGQAGSVEGVVADKKAPPEREVPEPADEEFEPAPAGARAIAEPLPAPIAAAGLSRESRRKLEGALSELTEAKRLLDQVR
jgi:DNA-binding transcriptional MerR regulator